MNLMGGMLAGSLIGTAILRSMIGKRKKSTPTMMKKNVPVKGKKKRR